jgi:hypothetical protein
MEIDTTYRICMCYRWGLAKMESLEREHMFPLEQKVNNTLNYNIWYAQKRVVNRREKVHQCKVRKAKTNVGPSGKGLVLLARNKSRGGYFKDAQRYNT